MNKQTNKLDKIQQMLIWTKSKGQLSLVYPPPSPIRVQATGVGGGGRQQQTYHFLCKWNRDKIIP